MIDEDPSLAAPLPARSHKRRLVLEPAGRIFLPLFGICALLGWAAGGVGLLFAALGLSALSIALLAALRNTSHLQLRVLATPAHSVGDSFLFPLEVHCDRGLGSTRDLFVSIVEPRQGSGKRSANTRPIGGLVQLDAGETRVVQAGYRHLRRGLRRELQLVLHSSYPFGLIRVDRHFDLEVSLLAWPRLGRLRRPIRRNSRRVEASARVLHSRREEDEFYQLHNWRQGMSLRRVHWKLSARRGRPILQEYSGESDSRVRLRLLLFVNEREGFQRGERHSFESAVCLVATLARRHLERGATVTLVLHGTDGSLEELTGLRGRRGLLRTLDALALAEAVVVTPTQFAQQLRAAASGPLQGTLVYAGGSCTLPPELTSTGESPIDVDSATIDDLFQRSGIAHSEIQGERSPR